MRDASFSSATSSALIETCTLRLLVELDHACIDLLADGETVRRADRCGHGRARSA